VTWLPAYKDEADKTKLIHLGASAQHLYSKKSSVTYRSRPESYFAPRLVDTGDLDAQSALSWGIEVAVENGPLSLQAEWLQALAYRAADATLGFYGYYVAGSWLLTGESRPYNRNAGAFGRVVPRKTFSLRNGAYGAWELAARFSHLDLNDEEVKGGTMDIGTVGVNGHLTPRLKLMIDYGFGRVDRRDGDGDVRTLAGRMQYEL
jgi:phosphate-selective porin OprO and OprP